jgi:hypothetical protein
MASAAEVMRPEFLNKERIRPLSRSKRSINTWHSTMHLFRIELPVRKQWDSSRLKIVSNIHICHTSILPFG